jgi:hypothetical protein
MGDYRLFCIDGTGRFTMSYEIEAADDAEALAKARDMKLSVKCELWQRGRMVAVLDPSRA